MLNKILNQAASKFGFEGGGTDSLARKSSSNYALEQIDNPLSRSELVPYQYFEDKRKIFINDGDSHGLKSLGFVVEISPMVSLTDSQVQQIEAFIADNLLDSSYIQCLALADKDVGEYLDNWLNNKNSLGEVDQFFAERVKFFEDIALAKEITNIKVRNFRVIFSVSLKAKATIPELEKIYFFQQKLLAMFEAINIAYKVFEPEDLLRLTRKLLGVTRTHQDSPNQDSSNRELKYQVGGAGSAMQVAADKILFKNFENGSTNTEIVKAYSVDKFPREMFVGSLSSLLGSEESDSGNLSCEFYFSFTFANDIIGATRNALEAKGLNAQKNAESFVTRFNRKIPKIAEEWRVISEELDKKSEFYSTNFQIILRSKEQDFIKNEQILTSLFAANGWGISADDFFHLPALQSVLPMTPASGLWQSLSYFNHQKTALLSEILPLMPLFGDWKGTEEPGMLLISRRGQLAEFSPFAERKNHNMCVVAPSGSGKSVFLQDLLLGEMSKNTRIFILDIGRSYEKVTHLLDGDFIEFQLNSGISLNPFTNIPPEEKDNFLDYIKQILCTAASPSGKISDLEKSIIEEALYETWDKFKNDTTITKVAEFLKQKGTKEAENLAIMLRPYTKNGSYGKFFEKPATIDFTNLLTVFEFEEIAAKEELLIVVMEVVAIQIVQLFSGDRSQRFILAIDEAWRTLKKFAPLLERFVRTFRKYGGALLLATQSYMDFKISTEAKTIWDNCGWHIFLPHDGDAVNSLKTTNDFAGNFLHLLQTLRKVSGKYSELLICSSQEMVIARLALDRYSAALYATDRASYNRLKQLQSENYSLYEAIAQIAEEAKI